MNAIERNKAESDSPLFLYLAFQSVHVPHLEPPSYLFGEADEDKLTNTSTHLRWHFGRTLVAMDRSIDRLFTHIHAQELQEKTLVVVASDNGACPSDGGNNYPFRGGKFQSFEGGVHVPAFIWSCAFPSSVQGTVVNDLFHAVDWMPTLLSTVRSAYFEEMKGPDGHWDIDGMDLKEAFVHGSTHDGRPQRAEMLLRMNKWKTRDEEHLATMGFNSSYMALIYKKGETTFKLLLNQFEADRLHPSTKVTNESCFDSVGSPRTWLYDLDED